MSSEPNFVGHDGRECGEHRTVGPHRAWCHDCSEWCYPDSPCVRCEVPTLREQVRRRDAAIQAVLEITDGLEGWPYTRVNRAIAGALEPAPEQVTS